LSGPEPTFDLQSHSIHSDGELTPSEVVSRAAQAGVTLLSLTDHDSLAGVAEAQAEADARGISLVTGVEITTLYGSSTDLHILGYLVDPTHPGLQERLERSRNDRQGRAQRMIEALQELGYAVDEDALRLRAASGKTVGRPHIAQAVVSQPDNGPRLAEEGLTDPSAFLVHYLIEGRPAYREREAPTVAEAVELIHAAGGLAVWAHPFWDFSEDEAVISALDSFRGSGIDGVEAFYVTHTATQTGLLVDRSAEIGILTTGSSDFHGPGHRQFNRFRAFQTYGLSPSLGPLDPDR
jgi:predicted metal-dependent phosphoesterase TrpH